MLDLWAIDLRPLSREATKIDGFKDNSQRRSRTVEDGFGKLAKQRGSQNDSVREDDAS
jgi:hypothetical protein